MNLEKSSQKMSQVINNLLKSNFIAKILAVIRKE